MPWSKVAILGMVIPPFNRIPYNVYINPYYWVDDHPLLYGNNGSLDPGTYELIQIIETLKWIGFELYYHRLIVTLIRGTIRRRRM